MALTKVSGSLIKSDITVGVVTATSFIGPLTGDVTGNITGNITGSTASFTGNVSVGGTLTYDDVTNIDSVGLITARTGIHVTGGSVGIGTDNPSGKLNIVGSDSQLLNLIQDSGDLAIRLNDRGTGSAYIKVPDNSSASLTFETGGAERLRITSDGKIGIGTISVPNNFNVEIANNGTTGLNIRNTNDSANDSCRIAFSQGSGNLASSNTFADIFPTVDTVSPLSGHIKFRTNEGNNLIERLRIGSAGQIGLSGDNYGTAGEVLTSGGPSAAPTWSVAGSGTGKVLEVLTGICDGTAIPYSNGTFTPYNITAVQNLTTSFAFVIGSNVTYEPPAGTSKVVYEFHCQLGKVDATTITSWKLFLDSVEVTKARHEYAAEDLSGRVSFKWVFGVGGTADASTGRMSSWTSSKSIKIEAREYGSSYECKVHSTNWWEGGGTDQLSLPVITVTAIG